MKKKVVLWSSSALICLMAASCGNQSEGMWDSYELLPVQQKEDGPWSFIDKDGKIFYEDEFKNTPTIAYNGYFSVPENNGYTIYKSGGQKPVVLADCEGLKSVGVFEEDLIPVTFPNKRISILDKNGKQKFELNPVNGMEIVACDNSFSEGMLLVKTEENKWGYVDASGNLVIKANYDDANEFSEGLAVVGEFDESSYTWKYKVIDKKGNTIFTVKEKYTLPQHHKIFLFDYLLVMEDDRFVLLDRKGEPKKLSAKIKSIEFYTPDYIVYKNEDGEAGLMDYDGEVIIRPKYNTIQLVNDNTFFASKDGKYVILNSEGDETYSFDFKYVYMFYQFGFFVTDNGRTYNVVDDKGKEKSKIDIRNISVAPSPSAVVESDFFDYVNISQKIADMIDGNTVGGKYEIGENASGVMKYENPSDYKYRYKSEVKLEGLKKSGYRYSIEASGYFSENIVNYDYSYSWNPDAILQGITINLSVKDHIWGDEGFEALINAFKNKGYKVEKQGWAAGQDDGGINGAVLTKGNSEIVIQCDRGDSSEADVVVTNIEILPVSEATEGLESYDDLE